MHEILEILAYQGLEKLHEKIPNSGDVEKILRSMSVNELAIFIDDANQLFGKVTGLDFNSQRKMLVLDALAKDARKIRDEKNGN